MAAKLIYLTDEEFELLTLHLNFSSKNKNSIRLEHNIMFMRDKFEEKEMEVECEKCKGTRVISKKGKFKCMECRHEWEFNEMSTKPMMTRAEAINKLNNVPHAVELVRDLQSLGLLELKEERKTTICFMGKDDEYVEIWKENKLIKTLKIG